MWTYLAYGPFDTLEAYLAQIHGAWMGTEKLIHAIIDHGTGRAVGLVGFMAIKPESGSIEIGAVMYSPRLQRTIAGTEAMYLMLTRVFDELRYRRCEWRCHALNAASLAAANRLGFRLEGICRQAEIVKGHNRDTAWLSIVDGEWPRLKAAFEAWLAPTNFDHQGRQHHPLGALRAEPGRPSGPPAIPRPAPP